MIHIFTSTTFVKSPKLLTQFKWAFLYIVLIVNNSGKRSL